MMKIQKRQISKLRAQAGFTVVELSVAVAIAGILLVGAISLVQVVLQTSRANDTAGGLARVFAQIEKYYNNSQSYSGIDVYGMVGLGVFQGPFTLTGSAPKQGVNSRFGYPVQVEVATNYGGVGAARAYGVFFTGIPQKVCGDIVTAADSTGVKAIAINPETTAGQIAGAFDTTLMGQTTGFTTTGSTTIVKGTDNNGVLNTNTLTGAGGVASGCNVASSTVTVALINWK